MVDAATGAVGAIGGVLACQKLLNKCVRCRAGFCSQEVLELTIGEVSRVRSDKKKELTFALGVAEKLKPFALKRSHAHTDRTSRTSPVSFKARRIRLASPARA